MDFKRNSVIALYLAGKSNAAIVKELQHLKVNKMFVSRTINRYKDTGSVKNVTEVVRKRLLLTQI